MQAITVKYIGPTDMRGSRLKATAEAGSITVDIDHGMPQDLRHSDAAMRLCAKLGWSGELVQGTLSDGRTSVFVFTGK